MSHKRVYAASWPMWASAILVAVLMALLLACGSPPEHRVRSGEGGGVEQIWFAAGLASLQEQIAGSPVIVRAQLSSVSSGTTRWDPNYWPRGTVWTGDAVTHVGTLEHTFTVLEYLKGTGGNQIVAVVLENHPYGRSTGDASADGAALLAGRDNQWDGRQAILFLRADYGPLLDLPQDDRYYLGSVFSSRGRLGDYYTIASPNWKSWLPGTPAGALGASSSGSRGASGSQRFLLDVPDTSGDGGGVSGASVQFGSDNTITLSQMKTQIAVIEQEVALGDGSEVYRQCIYEKQRTEREARTRNVGRDQPHVSRHQEAAASGLPAGTMVYDGAVSAWVVHNYGEEPTDDYGRFELLDNDADLFTVRYPGEVFANRPLPAGAYRFFFNVEFAELIPCDGQPEVEKRDSEITIMVTAPEGTLHEAFFDPQTIGPGDGYISSDQRTAGELSPATFTIGNTTTTISSLFATENAVTMVLTTPLSLPDHSLDFIALDGSVPLSLDWGAATTSGSTLTWNVAKQPWSSGNELMLRLRRGSPITTPHTDIPLPDRNYLRDVYRNHEAR